MQACKAKWVQACPSSPPPAELPRSRGPSTTAVLHTYPRVLPAALDSGPSWICHLTLMRFKHAAAQCVRGARKRHSQCELFASPRAQTAHRQRHDMKLALLTYSITSTSPPSSLPQHSRGSLGLHLRSAWRENAMHLPDDKASSSPALYLVIESLIA
eukprot:1137273-Pelagomonas_calceolata.AAC.3